MDEGLSWRARLAKSNINILNIAIERTNNGIIYRWFFEFTYHPKPGTFKWCKTYIDIPGRKDDDGLMAWTTPKDASEMIMTEVLKLRKEWEG